MAFIAWADDGGNVRWAEVGLIGSSSPQLLGDRRTSAGLALRWNAGSYYMAWRGWRIVYYEGGPVGPDNHIWWSQLIDDGVSRHWTPQRPLTDRETNAIPALGSINGKLYMAWKGAEDPFLLWSGLDGEQWSSPQPLPDTHYWTDKGPALGDHATSVGPRLCMAWKSTYHNNAISWSELTPDGWFDQGTLDDRATSHSPALRSVNGQLYMVWKGAESDNTIWWSINDEDSWSPQVPLTDRWTDAQPALGWTDGALLMAWKAGTQILSSYLDGDEWSPPFVVGDFRPLAGPALD
jgi:hypothetical protein